MTGLFSNLDTDSIVKSMCSKQQARIDKVKQQSTKQEWLDDTLTSVKSDISTFMNSYLSPSGENSMLKSSTYMTFKATTPSTANSVSVTPTSSAESGSISVQVNKLAKNSSIESSGKVSRNGIEISANNTAKLSDLTLAKSLSFGTDNRISFAINGKTFSFTKDTTLQTMINTINSDKTANVTMKYSRLSDTFSITADSGGADSSVVITNYTGNAFGADSAFKIITGVYKNGNDSEAVINGSTITRDSNNYTIDGVTYELQKVTQGTAEEVVDFSLKRDFSATIGAVNKFVDAYNTLHNKLKSLLSEEDYSTDYPPLTEDQKTDMSSEQITAWEKKAKSGLLRNNMDLQSVLRNLQSSFYTAVGGTGRNVTELGITTSGYYDTNPGQIVINEDKLREALQGNTDMVINMFTSGSSTAASADQGLMYKVKSFMSNYTSTVATSITTGASRITSYSTQIKDMEKKLSSLADRYYAKFSNMETAMSKLNSQSSMISQMFGGSA
jgi:flagellar hook-associated protein 2